MLRILFLMLLVLTSNTGCKRRPAVILSQAPETIDFEFKDKRHPHSDENQENFPIPEEIPKEYFLPYQSDQKEYCISVGDVLEISIFGNDDTLVSEVVIAPDGRLYYMFIDGINAEGLTVSELSEEIKKRVLHLFVDPEVAILPKKIASQSYMILGKVAKPGVYPIISAVTLRQAIGEAGGIIQGGYRGTTISVVNLRNSFICRQGKKLPIDFEKLLYTEGFEQNIYVQPGDYIYIASALHESEIFLVGALREQKPIPYKDGLTLVSALSGGSGLVGGLTSVGNVQKILILRGSLEAPQTMQIDLLKILDGSARDVYLLPGDIVYVPNKEARFGRELVRSAIQAFVTAFGNSAGSHVANDHWFVNPK